MFYRFEKIAVFCEACFSEIIVGMALPNHKWFYHVLPFFYRFLPVRFPQIAEEGEPSNLEWGGHEAQRTQQTTGTEAEAKTNRGGTGALVSMRFECRIMAGQDHKDVAFKKWCNLPQFTAIWRNLP